jgi:hypothetical protein
VKVLRRIFFAALGLVTFASCSGRADSFLYDAIDDRFSGQFHRCVPLGWEPAPVDGSYVPSYSIEYSPRDAWLPPLWLGFLPDWARSTTEGRSTYRLLTALAGADLVEGERGSHGTLYRLTERAAPFYFEGNDFGNNPLHLPYLCYSTIVPDRLTSSAGKRKGQRDGITATFTVRFAWHSHSNAAWAADPVIQHYSVNLAPAQSPAVVEVAKREGTWEVARAYYDATNTLADPSAWAASPMAHP